MGGAVRSDASGVLITGLYGAGKSTVVEEIAFMLEDAAAPYGALDLDWLWWFGVPGLARHDGIKVLMGNLASVVDSYLQSAVNRFVMAWSVRDPTDLTDLRTALPFPIKVVELVVPLSVIDHRLATSVTTGREQDWNAARQWHRDGLGSGLGDVQINGDRPVQDVARDILDWLGWH
jgi:hypothetical protein